MTPEEFREIALAVPGAVEKSHMNHPDFRIGDRIFATLGYPNESFAMVKLSPEQQQALVAQRPKMFCPVPGAWGAKGCTNVVLPASTAAQVRQAVEMAWRRLGEAAPAKKSAGPRKPAASRASGRTSGPSR